MATFGPTLPPSREVIVNDSDDVPTDEGGEAEEEEKVEKKKMVQITRKVTNKSVLVDTENNQIEKRSEKDILEDKLKQVKIKKQKKD